MRRCDRFSGRNADAPVRQASADRPGFSPLRDGFEVVSE